MYAIDAGAYDGLFYSNTLELEKSGWTVLCIEPNPHMWEQLTSNRKLCLPYALGPENKDGIEFEVYCHVPWVGEAGLSSIKAKDDMLNSFSHISKEIVTVNMRTLDYCLEEVGFPKVDFVNLDVEGWELEVLSGFTFERWKPEKLCIENIFEKDEYRQFMSDKGYKLVGREEFNDIYVI
jgi:FkbM family methyltransferase